MSWENANRSSGGLAGSSKGTLRLSENITSYSAGEDAANSRYAAATDSTIFPRLARFRAFSKARPISWKPSIATAVRIPSRLPKWAYKTGWLYEISSDSRRTVTLDQPSSSAIRRAALIICARRACRSRSFRSAIRFATWLAIDRHYSAARFYLEDGESFPNGSHRI